MKSSLLPVVEVVEDAANPGTWLVFRDATFLPAGETEPRVDVQANGESYASRGEAVVAALVWAQTLERDAFTMAEANEAHVQKAITEPMKAFYRDAWRKYGARRFACDLIVQRFTRELEADGERVVFSLGDRVNGGVLLGAFPAWHAAIIREVWHAAAMSYVGCRLASGSWQKATEECGGGFPAIETPDSWDVRFGRAKVEAWAKARVPEMLRALKGEA